MPTQLQLRLESFEGPLELLSRDRLGELKFGRDRLAHRPRPQGIVLSTREAQGAQSKLPKAIGDRIARQSGEPPQG